jgi:predicted dehydrogenase
MPIPSQKSSPSFNRRQFLRYSALAASAAVAQGPFILRGQSLNNKLNIAIIGTGGKGTSDTDGLARIGENIVALCDIDERTLNARAKVYPKAKLFRDYRKMLEEMKEIDAVTVSTPDHHHAPASMMAIKLRKHVYCQKPLTHSIYEARKLAEAAREYKVATIMGNQGHSGDGIRSFCELIWAGAIGSIREVHAWTDRPIWPQGLTRPKGTEPAPAHIDWDLFLGPAPERPYNSAYHPFNWRGWWDFGTGALGDMACHVMDGLFWALKLGHADKVGAWSSAVNAETAPKWSVIRYQFPARGDMPALKLFWYDGGKQPFPELLGLDPGDKIPDNGTLLIGDKGKILTDAYGGRARFTDDSKVQEFPTPPKTLPRVTGHYQEFAEACKGGKPAGSNFDYAGPFSEMVLLGNLAVRCGKEFEWDGPNMKAKNCPEADRYIRREYRSGWTL